MGVCWRKVERAKQGAGPHKGVQEELAITISVGKEFTDVVHEYPDITVHLTLFNASIKTVSRNC